MPSEEYMPESSSQDKQNAMYGVAYCVATGLTGIELLYCLEQQKFYVYQNGYWKQIFELEILSTISKIKEFKWINNHSVSIRKQIIENLKLLLYKRWDLFNKHGYLNFPDGEFDPEKRELYTHEKIYYSTIRIPYPYNHSSKCPLWDKTLLEIFDNDMAKVNILQEFFGYCLTRDTRKEKALLLLGESRTGKSTILHVLNHLLGEDNCSNVALKYISHPQYAPMLMNKLVNIDTDVSGRAEEFEAEFKTITSGEPISCNQKYIETFKFRPYCKLVMAANEFPRITDHSSAFYKRLILIPCDRIFEEEEQDIRLKDKLLDELSGIFNWAVSGLKILNERGGFIQNDLMKKAVQELREENNPLDLFFKNHIEIDLTVGVAMVKKDLYDKYKLWSKDNEQFTLSAIVFSKYLYRKFSKITPKQSQGASGKRVWRNIRYVEDKLDEFKSDKEEIIQWQE